MSPESFNRLTNQSPKDLERFRNWLFKQTLIELRICMGDMPATRAAWMHYFRRGFKADLLLDELMAQLPELFRSVGYPKHLTAEVLGMIKAIDLADLGVERTETGLRFNPESN